MAVPGFLGWLRRAGRPRRLYEAPGQRTRFRVAALLLSGLVLLGIWYAAFQALAGAPRLDGLGAWVLASVFAGAGIVGLVRLARAGRDRVMALDVDEASGEVLVWLWSPFGPRRIRTTLSAFGNWRAEETRRRARYVAVLADLRGRQRPLIFAARPGADIPDGLDRLLPDAAAAFDDALRR